MHSPSARLSSLLYKSQVLDEIGVDITAQMGSAPAKKIAAPQKAAAAARDKEEESLTARLAALK